MSLPKGLNFNTAVIAFACVIGAWPLIETLTYMKSQPKRDEEVVKELRLIRNDLQNANALTDKRITVLENRVTTLESKP